MSYINKENTMVEFIKITGFATLLFLASNKCKSCFARTQLFSSDKKSVRIQLTNYSEQATLTQSWVDEGNPDSTPETTNAPFMPPSLKSQQMTGSITNTFLVTNSYE
ncbi:fimbria/pilus periplasmic chaperone [Providencia rettgeri]|nr:fimbria/pilus periplasmic chaperone [Providencia rettgeri]